jgi:hypothetical protein
MKKVVVLFLLFGIVLNLMAQDKINLDTLNFDQLNLYKEKAIKMRNTGAIMAITGGTAFIAGVRLVFNYMETHPIKDWGSDPEPNIYTILYLCGAAATIIGVPILIIGSNRKTKAEIALQKYDIKPTNSIAVGLGIKIRF